MTLAEPGTAPRRLRRPARQIDLAVRALCPVPLDLAAARERPWRTATFEGAEHRLLYRCTGPDAARAVAALAALLPQHEFALPGHVVIEAAVQSSGGTVEAPVIAVIATTIADG